MIQTFDTLYARDSKGKILEWVIEVQGGTQVDIKMSYGEYKGAKALKWQRNIKGKNTGKANETNPYEQAILEVESKIRLKKKKGYLSLEEVEVLKPKNISFVIRPSIEFKNLTEDTRDGLYLILDEFLPKNRTDADGNVKPMKAQQYYRSAKDKYKDDNGKTHTRDYWTDPYGERWSDRKYYYLLNPYVQKEKGAIITKFPCIGQPKINGVRSTIQEKDNNPVIKSKEGNVYHVAHINDFLTLNMDIFENNRILDGELYIHGELLQDIGSAINKPNLNTPRIVFILFDLACNSTNIQRWNDIKDLIKPKVEKHLNCPIQIISSVLIKNDIQAQEFTDANIKLGYEGAIFRQMEGQYAFGGRTQTMTKLKRTISEEFLIVDIIPQEKDSSKGNFVCITKEGIRFDVTPKGTDEFKRGILYYRGAYIGSKLTCDFYEWTKDKKPFHIINNTVRNYE